MGLTLSQIRTAIHDQLRANLSRDVNVDATGEGKPAPVVRVQLRPSDPIDYWVTFGESGIAQAAFEVQVIPANTDQSAVKRLDDFLSVGTGNGSSVVDALMADKTLGGVAQTIQINSSSYDPDEITATFELTIVLKKSGANA